MSNNHRIVAFERSPAYVHHRAMMNRRDNRVVDALELLRQAVERSPENREYKLDLAELYCEIGCHAQSNRLLLDMLAEKDSPAECYYGLALNQLGMNDAAGARKSLEIYRRREPQGAHAEEVMNLKAELDMFEELNAHGNRRLRRSARAAGRASEAMRDEDVDRACRLFEASLALAPGQRDVRALYAMALMLSGDGDAARREAEKALAGYPAPVRALCVCAQVFWHLGDAVRARQLVEAAVKADGEGQESYLILNTLGELGMDAELAEQARLALQFAPYDRELMHMRAVALTKTGAPDDAVERIWARILRIDPEDSVAAYFRKAAREGALRADELSYDYQVPPREYRARSLALLVQLARGSEAVKALWQEDAEFRQLVRWAIAAEEPHISRAAISALAGIDDADAQGLLREVLFSRSVGSELRIHGAMALKLRGRPLDALMPPEAGLTEEILPEDEKLLADLPVGERQLVRYADESLERRTGASALKALTLMWTAYRNLRGTDVDPLTHTQAAAAALVYNYLLFYGAKPPIGALSREFRCPRRQLVYYARRLAGCMEKMEEVRAGTDAGSGEDNAR